MKKSLLFIAVATATVFSMTSCQKEEVANQGFTARIEISTPGAKTILAGTHIHWDYGNDQVIIYDENNTSGVFTAQTHSTYSDDATCANLVNTDVTLSEEGGYKAIYPASIAVSNNTITLPQIQNSSNGELSEYPMYAESDTKSLQFKNLCSVLKLSLQKDDESVSKIQIVTDKLTTGTFQINYNSGNPTITPSSTVQNHTAVTTLQLGSNVSIDEEHDFYIYLPANSYNYMQVKVYNADGLMFFKTWQKADDQDPITFVRSQYNTLSFGENDIEFHEGNVNGLFHVSASKVVTFSKGNLLQSNSNTSNYKFADEQYNYTESGYTYRFIWGTSSANGFIEHGNDNIVNATGNWETMSASEWRYVTSSSSSTGRHNFITYHARAHLQVTKSGGGTVGGMVLFPDLFHWPLDASKEPPANSFDGGNISEAWNNVILTYNEWKVLEDAGCVFLPVTHGYQQGHQGGGSTSTNDSETANGYYWSKTWYSESDKAQYSFITPRSFLWGGSQVTWPNAKMSHRLVREVTE